MALKIVLFLSSVRPGRLGSRVGKYFLNKLQARGHNVVLFDPLELKFPLLEKPLHFHGPHEAPPDWLQERNQDIESADAFVVVSGEYNRCIPPALTNMMDHFPPKTYRCKPCSIVCYSAGPGGGSTAGMQLRYFLGELGMVTPGFMFTIAAANNALNENGIPEASNADILESKSKRLIGELEWYAFALKHQTETYGLPKID